MAMKKPLVFLLALLLIVPSPILAGSSKIKLVAISSDGEGILSDLEVEVVPGKGRILLTAEPLTGVNTQNSERIAAEIAGQITKTDLGDKDVIFTIHSDARIVDGPSAGAAMAIAIVGAISGNEFRNDVMLTGTMEEDGTVGQVGGILKKAKAVADSGAGQFLVPKGQRVQTEYVKKTESPAPGIYIETLQPVSIDVVEYAKSKWGLTVTEVGSINDAIGIMFAKDRRTNITEIAVPESNWTAGLELPNTTVSREEEESVKYVAEQELRRAEAAVLESNSSEARTLLIEGTELLDKGYFYSAANSAFLAAVIAKSQSRPAAQLKTELEGRIAQAKSRLVAENSTDVYHLDDSIRSVASAQQRYLWAEGALSGDEGGANGLSAGGEWLYAFDDMLHDIGPRGKKTIPRALMQARADAKTEDAQKALMNAEAVGGDTTDGARSLGFALLARSQSLPLAQLFNSIDAEAYALAAAESGSLASLVERARKLQDEAPLVSSGWGISYMKHSRYLLFLAQRDNSRGRAIDSIFMALRAKGVDDAFTIAAPAPATTSWPHLTNVGAAKTEDILGIGVFLAFTIAVWIMWREIRAMRREQRQVMHRLGEIEGQLLRMKPKGLGERRKR